VRLGAEVAVAAVAAVAGGGLRRLGRRFRLRLMQAAGGGRRLAGFGSATKGITTAVSQSTAP
jgi:hypothetical protein